MIAKNLEAVRFRLLNACKRSLRPMSSIVVIAVSKTHSVKKIREAFEAGQTVFGENYVQEALDKKEEFGSEKTGEKIDWHFIGRIQTNKIKSMAGQFALIHSVDRLEVLQKFIDACAKAKVTQGILLQVNVAMEETKAGFEEKELKAALDLISPQKWVELKGLMTMPPLDSKPENNRKHFKRLKQIAAEQQPLLKAPHNLAFLSMGSSQDFEIAVEEGATHVRIGTDIFGTRGE